MGQNQPQNDKITFERFVMPNARNGSGQAEADQPGGRKWLAGLCVVLYGMAFNGTIFGYTSPALPSLQSPIVQDNSSLHFLAHDMTITDDQASWFSSISQLGFPVGTLLSGVMMKFLGKRLASLFGLAVTYTLGYTLIFMAVNVEMLYAGRFFCGMCQGFCNCLTILYVLELCRTTRQQAICGVAWSVVGNCGTLLTYTLGIFVNWRQLAALLTTLIIPYVVGLLALLPNDSVVCCAKPKRQLTRIESLSLARQLSISHMPIDKASDAIVDMGANTDSDAKSQEDGSKCSTYCNWPSTRPVMVGFFMMAFYQFSGYNVVSFYAGSILQKEEEYLAEASEDTAGPARTEMSLSTLDPALVSATLVALAGLFGVLIGAFLVHKQCNRKRMMIASAIGTGTAFAALSGYFYADLSSDEDWLWLATLCLTLHILLFNIGYGCVGYSLMAESLPGSVRAHGMTAIVFAGGLLGFANAKSFSDMDKSLGTAVTFAVYAAINVSGAVYVAAFLPSERN